MKILAVDYGERFTGLAYSPDGVLSLPLEVLDTKDLLASLNRILSEKKIQQLVVGIPTMDNGQNTPLTEKIKNIFRPEHFSVPIVFINERGSTKSARKSVSSGRADDVAAQQILTYWLDSQ